MANRAPKVVQADYTKTQMCKFHILSTCAKGAACSYAHCVEELQTPPDLRCTKFCKSQLKAGRCTLAGCTYAHTQDELRMVGAPLASHDQDAPRPCASSNEDGALMTKLFASEAGSVAIASKTDKDQEGPPGGVEETKLFAMLEETLRADNAWLCAEREHLQQQLRELKLKTDAPVVLEEESAAPQTPAYSPFMFDPYQLPDGLKTMPMLVRTRDPYLAEAPTFVDQRDGFVKVMTQPMPSNLSRMPAKVSVTKPMRQVRTSESTICSLSDASERVIVREHYNF